MKQPTQEQIQRRAYELYQKHGKPGRDTENWLQAERELTEVIERDEKEATVWEDTSSRRDPNAVVATTRSSKSREFKKGF